MQINTINRDTPRARARQIGRGGKRGKTAGRGTKGQRARAGNKIRPEIRDLIKKLPKKRGYRFQSVETKPAVVNLMVLEKHFAAGAVITPATLRAKKLIRPVDGQLPTVKVLGQGPVSKAFTISGCQISASARTKLEAAGGSVA